MCWSPYGRRKSLLSPHRRRACNIPPIARSSPGPQAVPLLLRELEQRPNHWFAALKSLTGVDPVHSSDRGRIGPMTEAWIAWGKEHGFCDGCLESFSLPFAVRTTSKRAPRISATTASPGRRKTRIVGGGPMKSYWPEEVAREETVAAFEAAYETVRVRLVRRFSPRRGLRENRDLRHS